MSIKIELDNNKLYYCGRIDDSNPKRPRFIFPSSFLKFSFKGTGAWAVVSNNNRYWDNYIGIIVDGEQKKVLLSEKGKIRICLAEGAENCSHEVMIFKRQDGCHEFVLEELELEEGSTLLELPPKPEKRIEVYGDSVSAGEVSEAVEYTGKPDPEHRGEYSNSWYSYSWITARLLDAEIHNISQGGIALLNGTGWFCPPEYVGMEQAWDKVRYNPELGPVTKWDFRKYRPQLVIVAIGQNDSHPEDYMKEAFYGEKAIRWRESYRIWIEKIREKYPKAAIILSTTILNHDPSWDQAIHQIWKELGDPRIYHFRYSDNGTGTPGHIRIPEAWQMARELSSFIKTLPEEIWKDEAGEGNNDQEGKIYL